jgi:hypothetical protein
MLYAATSLVGTWLILHGTKTKYRRQKEIAEAAKAAKRIHRTNEKSFGPHVAKIMEIYPAIVRSDATSRTVSNIEPFRADCACPKCGSWAYHWLAPISRLTRQRKDGQLRSKVTQLVNRYCRECDYSWVQK